MWEGHYHDYETLHNLEGQSGGWIFNALEYTAISNKINQWNNAN